MPHISVEYTPNLAGELDLDALVQVLHDAAQALELFPRWGVRVLAFPATTAYVACSPENAYVQVRVKIAPGRPDAARVRAAEELYSSLDSVLAPLAHRRPLGYQLDVFEFDADVTRSGGSLPGSPTASAATEI